MPRRFPVAVFFCQKVKAVAVTKWGPLKSGNKEFDPVARMIALQTRAIFCWTDIEQFQVKLR